MVGAVFVAEEFTVTLKAQVLVLPAASVAVQVTIVSPSGNTEPEGGAQLAVTPGQLSVVIGAGKLTFTLFAPAAALATIFAGQVIDGG
jgi:xanthine/CO dehydrogenase XdhC/CoxF family maturation factor